MTYTDETIIRLCREGYYRKQVCRFRKHWTYLCRICGCSILLGQSFYYGNGSTIAVHEKCTSPTQEATGDGE